MYKICNFFVNFENTKIDHILKISRPGVFDTVAQLQGGEPSFAPLSPPPHLTPAWSCTAQELLTTEDWPTIKGLYSGQIWLVDELQKAPEDCNREPIYIVKMTKPGTICILI